MARGQIREVEREDLPAIARIVRECGFPERSEAGWNWVLFDNPDQDGVPPGWVVERDGAVVGFLGNFAVRYRLGERTLRAAIGHTVVTDLSGAGRQAGIALIRAGLRQDGVDLYSTLDNNALSARILPRVGAQAWLGAAGREWLEWPTAPLRILASRAARALRRPGPDTEAFSSTFATDFAGPSRPSPRITVEPLQSIDDIDLKRLLQRVADTGRAVRVFDRKRLDYRLADPDRASGFDYLVACMDGAPALLAATLVTKPSADGLEHVEIADWIGVDDADGIQVQHAVLRHVLRQARRAGLAKVRLHFPRALPAAVTSGTGWYLRRCLDYDPCHVQFRDPAMRDAWAPLPGDADYFFAYRTPPAMAVQPGG